MNRKDMKPSSGMLFIWKDSQIRNFWMKNTHFNLDLFFLNKQGEIVEIYKNAKAFDETSIKSQNEVNFVVELNIMVPGAVPIPASLPVVVVVPTPTD